MQAVKYGDDFRFPLACGELTQPGPRPRLVRQRRLHKQIAEEQERNIAEADGEIRAQRELPHNSIDPSGKDEISEDLPASRTKIWTRPPDVITRHHREPRSTLSIPKADSCPLPLEYLDVLRRADTKLSHAADAAIYDHWKRDGEKELSGPWTGRAVLNLQWAKCGSTVDRRGLSKQRDHRRYGPRFGLE